MAAFDLTGWLNLAAGIGILLVGLFVLVARPRATLNRVFFLMAVFDGVSTILFEYRFVTDDFGLRGFYVATYYHFFIAFIATSIGFGLIFPRPWGGARRRPWLIGIPLAFAFLTLGAFMWDRNFFWSLDAGGNFRRTHWGMAVSGAWIVGSAFVMVKLMGDTLDVREPVSVRRQAGFVLAGFLVGSGTVFVTIFLETLTIANITFGSQDVFVRMLTWAYAVMTVLLVGLFVRLLRARAQAEPTSFRFLLIAFGGIVVLSTAGAASQSAAVLGQLLGLIAYPLLLAYAIVGNEAFQINAQLRRATAITLAGAGIASVFITVENIVQDYVAGELTFITSELAIDFVAAQLAALIILPSIGIARRIVHRFLPIDMEHAKNLAVYRFAVEGALEDGFLEERESRTLEALRERLRVSNREHADILRSARESYELEHRIDSPAPPPT